MKLYPEVQAKARKEIDRVCNDRLPNFDDRSDLPYIDALCIELTRWAVVAPLGKNPTTPLFRYVGQLFGDRRIPTCSDPRRHLQRLLHPGGMLGLG